MIKAVKTLPFLDINTFYLTKHFIPQSIIEHRKESFAKIENIIYAQQSKDKFEYTADANNLAFSNTNFYDITYTKAQLGLIEELIWVIQNKQKIIIKKLNNDLGVYHKGYGIGNIIYLLSLKYHRGVLHLCTFSETINKAVIIPFDTLEEFTVTEKHFNPSKYQALIDEFFNTHFGITENINSKVYPIEIEFSKPTGLFIKQFFWHNSQKFSELKNGNVLMQLTCGINRELVGWIFQWMSNVKVKKPALLKKMVHEKFKDCLELYDKDIPLKYNNSFTVEK